MHVFVGLFNFFHGFQCPCQHDLVMLHVPKREFWTSTFLFTSLWSWLDVCKIDFKEQIPWWKWIFCYSTDHWPHKQKYKIHRHLNKAGFRGNWRFNWIFFSSCYWRMPYEICSYLRYWLSLSQVRSMYSKYTWKTAKNFSTKWNL